jgi:hypothetical protein
MKKHILSFLLLSMILTLSESFAQEYDPFADIIPRPKEAYVREFFSAAFGLQGQIIMLDPANPAFEPAFFLNHELLKMGFDTLAIELFNPDHILQTAGLFLTLPNESVNELLDTPYPEKIEITKDFPGREGYIIDVLPIRAIISGSDEQGLHFGVITLLQLLKNMGGDWVFACRVVDAPSNSNRWYRYSTNFLVGDNMTKTKEILKLSSDHKLNGVALDDYKFNFIEDMPQRYTDSLYSFKQYADIHNMEIIPCVMHFGYSSGLLYHNPNLASGLPVYGQKFYIENKTGHLVPGVNVSMSNGDFEENDGDNFTGFLFIDQPGEVSFVDTEVKHSGMKSIRLENFTSNEHGHGRISYWTDVKPFTQYHVSGWIKTEDLDPTWSFNISVLDENSKNLSYWKPHISSTNDWERFDLTFNSLEAERVGLYIGVWEGRSGKIWFDDLAFEESAFVNLLRRDGCPLNVSHQILDIAYIEGMDYDTLIDEKTGNNKWPGDFDPYHEPPVFRAKDGGHIQDGDTLLISYYHAIVLENEQVMITMSEDEVYDIAAKHFEQVDQVFDANKYFMQHDEIRVMNWDRGDQNRGLSPAEILGDNITKCYEIIEERKSDADVWIWSDMIDNFHNARNDYYLVNGDLTNAIDFVPNQINVMNWNGRDEIVQNSLSFFEDHGHRQMSAPFYDNDESQIRKWKDWTRFKSEFGHFDGMMYTTWQNDFDYIPHFAEYSWGNAPYIYHFPPYYLNGNELSLEVLVAGDKWDDDWELDNVMVCYRLDPNYRFTCKNFVIESGKRQSLKLEFDEEIQWIQYVITAIDKNEWQSTVPYGSRCYEIGEFPSSVKEKAAEDIIVHPNPADSDVLLISGFDDEIEIESIVINNILGDKLITFKNPEVNNGEIIIDIDALPSGIYILMIRTIEWNFSKKFARVKQ